jgi:acyl-coenzyme A synthetase/AMP-(fatty) acid ligase
MAEWIALNAVACQPRSGRVVARWRSAHHVPGVLDHAAFRAQVAAWRAAFFAHAGARYALYFDDAVTFAAALFGAWHAGKTVLLCADVLPQTLARLDAEVDGWAGDVPATSIRIEPQSDVPDAGDMWPVLDEQTTRLQVLTSGSTGTPVVIDKTLAQLAREVEAQEQVFGARLGDAQVHGTVSHQHIYGLLFRVLWPLAAGRALLPRVFFLEDLIAAMDAPAVLVSSPAHLKRIPTNMDWQAARSQLRAVFSSGGALPAEAAADVYEQFGQAVIEIFGSSETGGIAWRQNVAAGSAWTPLPGVQWRIVDAQLEVTSPHLPNADWWRTQDRVEADAGGGFRLLGRADRIVKVEERRVSLTALERQLLALAEVAEARVVLLDGARAQLAAVVCLSELGAAHLQKVGQRSMTQYLSLALAQAQEAVTRPRRWRFVDVMPMSAQGKTTDAALAALFRPERPQPIWQLRTATQAQLTLVLDPALIVFDGHFPQFPILPGVAQLDWAVRFGREAFAINTAFLRMDALKFQQVARPGLPLQLHLEWRPEKATLQFRYVSELGTHASGRVVFAGVSA